MPSVWYRKLEPAQEPFDEGTDSDRRMIVGFNVDADKDPTPTWLQELAAIVIEKFPSFVTNENLLLSSAANIPGDGNVSLPGGDGPYITIIDTGGMSREHIHNNLTGYQRPSAKVRVHARLYMDAYNMAFQIHGAFILRNKRITPIDI
jgi:hypothetical protein